MTVDDVTDQIRATIGDDPYPPSGRNRARPDSRDEIPRSWVLIAGAVLAVLLSSWFAWHVVTEGPRALNHEIEKVSTTTTTTVGWPLIPADTPTRTMSPLTTAVR